MKSWYIAKPSNEVLEKHMEVVEQGEGRGTQFGMEEPSVVIDCHQTILNIGYKWWQAQEEDPEKKKLSYNYIDMIDYISETYGEIFAGLILIGKYNQQVTNNGHYGYYDNGYADGTGSCGRTHDFNHPLHQRLMRWTKTILDILEEAHSGGNNQKGIDTILTLKELYEVLKKFMSISIDCDKTIIEREWVDGKYEEDEYPNEDYGQMDYKDSERVNEEYFNICDKVNAICESISEILINNEPWFEEETKVLTTLIQKD